jgi:transcriptional regulator with XRE-family HTH domain
MSVTATMVRQRGAETRTVATGLMTVTVPGNHPTERDTKLALARRLRGARALLDVDQQSLAEASGVSRNFISAMERAAQNLDAYRLSLVATALGMPLPTLLTGAGFDLWIEGVQSGRPGWLSAAAVPPVEETAEPQ